LADHRVDVQDMTHVAPVLQTLPEITVSFDDVAFSEAQRLAVPQRMTPRDLIAVLAFDLDANDWS
jgi:hypothetical protein